MIMWTWIAVVMAGIAIVMVMIVEFFRRKKMKLEPTGWNEKKQQIMTKGGACLFDKKELASCLRDIREIFNARRRLTDKVTAVEDDVIRVEAKANSVKDSNEVICSWRNTYKAELQSQLQCSAKGHGKWVYVKKEGYKPMDGFEPMWQCRKTGATAQSPYIFKCSTCNLEITKTKKELTQPQRDGLKKLGLL